MLNLAAARARKLLALHKAGIIQSREFTRFTRTGLLPAYVPIDVKGLVKYRVDQVTCVRFIFIPDIDSTLKQLECHKYKIHSEWYQVRTGTRGQTLGRLLLFS